MSVPRRLFFVCLLCCLLSGWHEVADAQTAGIETFDIEAGLSQGMIFDLLQTRDGFLWVATKDGLNRYDGYNFKVYSKNTRDSFSLSENTITVLFEDSRGLLWIGTENNGINLFDRATGRFHHLDLMEALPNPRKMMEVLNILETPDGALWAAQSGNSIFRIEIPKEWKDRRPDKANLNALVRITPLFLPPPSDPSQVFLPIRAFNLLDDNHLLINSHQDVYQLDIHTLLFTRLPIRMPAPRPGFEAITSVLRIGKDEYWIAGDQNLTHLEQGRPQNLVFQNITLYTQIKTDRSGHEWFIAQNKVWRLQPGKIPDPSAPDYVLDRDVASVLQDRNGNIWFGTRGYGLRKCTPLANAFHAGAAGTSINGLWEDPQGRVFTKIISIIYRYDTLTRSFATSSAFPDAPNRQMDLAFSPEGDTWLLCGIKGDNEVSQLRCYPAHGGPVQSFSFKHHVYPHSRLLYDPTGYIWITGNGGQLLRFNLSTRLFKSFDYTRLFEHRNPAAVRAFAITRDANGILWIGTQYGLVRAEKNGDDLTFTAYEPRGDGGNGPGFDFINCLLPDPEAPGQVLWIGTKGGGLDRFDQRTGYFTHLTIREGLPNDVIYGILPDAYGNLWCSTNRGIARLSVQNIVWPPAIDPQNTPLRIPCITYTQAEGLQHVEFNTQAYYKAPGGALLFGGVNGINRFYPNAIATEQQAPKVVLTGLEINHLKQIAGAPDYIFDRPVEYLQNIELNYDQNNISFEFAALDYGNPSKNRYRYQLKELEKNWVDAGNNHFAHYTHLPPGHYVFRVQGCTPNGVWSENTVEVPLVIHPPFWRSKAAYFLYFLLVSWLVWKIYRFQINRIRLRQQLLFEQRETERVRALEEMKTNFFANITHEFRTPLTLIQEPVRQLIHQPDDPRKIENLQLIDRNSRQLLDLVNQLLDLAKLESRRMGIDLRLGNVSGLLQTLVENFQPLADQKNINLQYLTNVPLPDFLFDSGKLETILNNLLSNALKFTTEGGEVVVELLRSDHETSGRGFEIRVSDTGIGIPPEGIDRIFDRFYQVEGAHNSSGTGIGLALCHELTTLLGGRLVATSQPGQGSTFSLWLPLLESLPPQAATPATMPLPENEAVAISAVQSEPLLALVIEDNQALRNFIRHCIAGNWRVEEAVDGVEGIRKAIELVPDIVISDLMMPGANGYEVCAALKNNEICAHIPVILLTARTALEARIKGLQAGADDYLGKPFNADELQARMHNLVAIRRRLLERFAGGSSPDTEQQQTDGWSDPDREFLRRFTHVIEQYLDNEAMGVEEFAGKMYVSRVQLHRKMKALTGKPASDFIRDYRLDRAMTLLRNREGNVAEVAARVGFVNEKYFSVVFKEKFGRSPSQID
ncbi:MAG: two-component regulator propeller domain-containing protein [Saprospiraceae bacterium]